MLNILKYCFLLFLMIICIPSLYTQNCEVFLYTTDDGLPQNNITQLMFDAKDRLWIGTEGGLCLFYGQKMCNINHESLLPRISHLIKYQDTIFVSDGGSNLFKQKFGNQNIEKINSKKKTSSDWFFDSNIPKLLNAEGGVENQTFFLVKKLSYKNIKKFKENGTEYHVSYQNAFLYLNAYIFLDTFLVGRDILGNWFKFTNDCFPELIISHIPDDFYSKGFVFNTDENTFLLYNNIIYKFKLYENLLLLEKVTQNVPLDKDIDQIVTGQFNQNTGFFYFGSSKFGLFEVIPTSFEVIKHESKSKNLDRYGYGYAYYSQAEIDTNTFFVNNYLILKKHKDAIISKTIPFNRAVNWVDSKGWLWYSDDQNINVQKEKHKEIISLSPLSYPIQSMTEIGINKYLLLHSHYIIEIDTSKETRRFKLNKFQDSHYEYGQYIYFDKNEEKIHMLSNKKIYTVNLVNSTIESNQFLADADYRIMSPLKDDLKFIGTYGQGYLLYDGKKWTNMPLDKKGYLKFAHAALCDSNGHVWISTNNGLFRTRLQDMIDYTTGKSKDIFYYYYDKSSGFLTNEFNGGCQSPAIKLRDGRFSFSSMDGLVQFDPLKVPALFPNNPLQLIHLSLNGQEQDSMPSTLVIRQDIKDIKLEVSTAYYGHPDNLVIQYKIPGYVEAWTDLTDQRYIILQNATHGNFNIEIRKRHGFGNSDFDYISYPVIVQPYFYQTWWFISILFLIGFFLTYLFSRWYNRYMIQKNMELEILILKSNKEVRQTNEELHEQVKQNDLFQSIFVHDIKSPIRFITSNTALLKSHWNHLDTTIKQDQISHIHDAATKIDHFIEETLLWIKIRNGELQLETNDFQALAMIQECIDFHKESDKIIRGDIQILADVHQDLYLTQDERLLATIIRNLISNSIKYTAHGKIIVYFLSKPNGSFTIGCKDTGKGMPKSLVEKLLSDHYRGNDIRDDSFKMGYVIIKEIVRLIGGQLHIESEENHGTHVWVEFSNL